MKNISEAVKRLNDDESNYLYTYDDGDAHWPHPRVYPGYVPLGNLTISVGLLLDQSGLESLSAVGIKNPQAVKNGTEDITQEQSNQIVSNLIPRYAGYARDVLPQGMFDRLTEARQYALLSMAWNLGASGIAAWKPTWELFIAAQNAKDAGSANAHELFDACADHMLTQTEWLSQVGNRARRIISMIRTGEYCDPQGNGS